MTLFIYLLVKHKQRYSGISILVELKIMCFVCWKDNLQIEIDIHICRIYLVEESWQINPLFPARKNAFENNIKTLKSSVFNFFTWSISHSEPAMTWSKVNFSLMETMTATTRDGFKATGRVQPSQLCCKANILHDLL
jgi:hypothetical protein